MLYFIPRVPRAPSSIQYSVTCRKKTRKHFGVTENFFPSVPILFPSFRELREFRDPKHCFFFNVDQWTRKNFSEKIFSSFFSPPPLRLLRRHSELGTLGRLGKKFENWCFCTFVGTCRKLPKMTFLGFWELGKTPSVTPTHVLFYSESSESSQLKSIFCNLSKENSETFWCYRKLFSEFPYTFSEFLRAPRIPRS